MEPTDSEKLQAIAAFLEGNARDIRENFLTRNKLADRANAADAHAITLRDMAQRIHVRREVKVRQ